MANKKDKEKLKEKERKADFRENFKIYWGFVKNYKLLFILTLVFVLLHETKQIFEKYLIKIGIDRATDFVGGLITLEKFGSVLLILGGLFLLGVFISIFSNWAKIHFVNRLECNTIFDLKQKYFNHLIGLDHKFFTTHKTESLISRLTRGSGAIERLTDVITFEFAPLILQFIVLTATLIYLDKTSAIIIGTIFVLFLVFSLVIQKKVDRYNLLTNEAEDTEKANIADIFTNVDSIKYFGKEKNIKTRYEGLSTETKRRSLSAFDLWRSVSAGQSLILGLGTFFLLFFSFRNLMNGTVTLGTLTFVYTSYGAIIGPLFGFVHGIRNFSRSMTDFQDLFEYGRVNSSIKDKKEAKEIRIERGEIEFKNVNFKYNPDRHMFENFNLKIPRNKKVALVGHSGCGKSSLIKLLYRLYDIDSGSITVDGKDIRDVKHESLRSEMSIVPQECILFDDTVYNNIKFANPKATRKQVMEAIKFAQLDKVIRAFPKKEETIVGERGVKLSGGEKQRVSIARAILADKKVLVLDEATSALDSETEWQIQQDLEKLMKGRTSIVIAHRLSTIMKADIIVVMKEGKIEQMGTHRELITEGGEYARLWDFQKGGFVE